MVVPVAMQVSTPPPVVIEATPGAVEYHVPPLSPVVLREREVPTQATDAPVMDPATGVGITFTGWMAITVPQLLVTE